MKVVGVGFGRTGTASLSEALEHLGFGPCYHMFGVIEEPARMQDWIAAAEGRDVDWDAVFDGYESTVDWPGAAFWREITAHYPQAKVILTVRDAERWYDSAARTIFKQALVEPGPLRRAAFGVLTKVSPGFRAFIRLTDSVIQTRVFGGRLRDRQAAIEAFNAHIEDVCAEIDPDRLLVYNVADGWAPLCAFLNTPVPDTPFPRGNDAATFEREDRRRMSRLILKR